MARRDRGTDPRNFRQVSLRCPDCSTVHPIIRLTSHQREKGHVKDLWCTTCKAITKQVELKPKETQTYADRWGCEEAILKG